MWVRYFIFWRGPTWHCEELLFEKRGERRVLDTFSQDMESWEESRRNFGKCEGNTFLESQISSPIEKAQFVLMNYYFVWDGSLEQMVFYLGKKKNDLVGPKGDEIRLLDFIIYLFSSFTSYSHIQGEIKNVLWNAENGIIKK